MTFKIVLRGIDLQAKMYQLQQEAAFAVYCKLLLRLPLRDDTSF